MGIVELVEHANGGGYRLLRPQFLGTAGSIVRSWRKRRRSWRWGTAGQVGILDAHLLSLVGTHHYATVIVAQYDYRFPLQVRPENFLA